MIEWQSVLITPAQKKKCQRTVLKHSSQILLSRELCIFWKSLGLTSSYGTAFVGLQAFQKGLIKGIVSVTNLASKLVEAKKYKGQFIPVADAAYYLAIDALTLLGHSAFEFSMKRREMLKSEVAPGSKSLCRDSQPITSMLCGDKLTQSIRELSGDELPQSIRELFGDELPQSIRELFGDELPQSILELFGDELPQSIRELFGDELPQSIMELFGDELP